MKNVKLRHHTFVSMIMIFAGLWLLASPHLLFFEVNAAAFANSIGIGLILVILGVPGALELYQRSWMLWLSVASGLWLLISPWFLGFALFVPAMWNQLLVGGVVTGFAAWAALASEKTMGGPQARI